MYEDYAPCAVCGSPVRLAARDPDPAPVDDGPVGPEGGVVGTADETPDARICTNPDCATHSEAADAPTP